MDPYWYILSPCMNRGFERVYSREHTRKETDRQILLQGRLHFEPIDCHKLPEGTQRVASPVSSDKDRPNRHWHIA